MILSGKLSDGFFEGRVFVEDNIYAAIGTRSMVMMMVKIVTKLNFVLPANVYTVRNGECLKQVDGPVYTRPIYVWAQ